MCCILCLPAKTFVDVQNGADVWKRYIDPKLNREEVSIKGAMGAMLPATAAVPAQCTSILSACPPCLFPHSHRQVEGPSLTTAQTRYGRCEVHVARPGVVVEHACDGCHASRAVLLAVAVATKVCRQRNAHRRYFYCSLLLYLFNAARGARSEGVSGRAVHRHEANRRRQTANVSSARKGCGRERSTRESARDCVGAFSLFTSQLPSSSEACLNNFLTCCVTCYLVDFARDILGVTAHHEVWRHQLTLNLSFF